MLICNHFVYFYITHNSQLMKPALILFAMLVLFSCKKDPYIAEGAYINPPKDTINFAYRVSDLYYLDSNANQTRFQFLLDTGIGYFWREILIKYDETNKTKQYTPEYTDGRLTRLVDMSSEIEDIDIRYVQLNNGRRVISTILYKREQNPVALQFLYENDTSKIQQIIKRKLNLNGDLGIIEESIEYCPDVNLGACSDSTTNLHYQYSGDANSLNYCNELLPFIFLLSKPNFKTLGEISPFFPYIFSKKLPQSATKNQQGSYQYGLYKNEPTFLYFKSLNSLRPEGFQFSMRIY